jgi:RNA polymerase sigma factor (sigma-70 family)
MAANEDQPASVDRVSQNTPAPVWDPASLVAMRTAWVDLYDAEYHSVVRFVMRTRACPLEDARDATEDAFVESWELMTRRPERWSKIRYKRAWIRTVALRRQQRPPGSRQRPLCAEYADIPDRPAPGLEPGELTVQTQAVLHALRELDDQARVVMAFLTDHVPVAEIADTLGMDEQDVRNVIRKARATLKRTLDVTWAPEGRDPR